MAGGGAAAAAPPRRRQVSLEAAVDSCFLSAGECGSCSRLHTWLPLNNSTCPCQRWALAAAILEADWQQLRKLGQLAPTLRNPTPQSSQIYFIIHSARPGDGSSLHTHSPPLAARLLQPAATAHSTPNARLAPRSVLLSSMAMVMGPTPPGTGVICEAFLLACSKCTSPTSLRKAAVVAQETGQHLGTRRCWCCNADDG